MLLAGLYRPDPAIDSKLLSGSSDVMLPMPNDAICIVTDKQV